jgi:hypothetical protein
VHERGLHQWAERGDQQRRTVAAAHRALEVGRNLDREQHRAGGK